jgi:hypothetical protein
LLFNAVRCPFINHNRFAPRRLIARNHPRGRRFSGNLLFEFQKFPEALIFFFEFFLLNQLILKRLDALEKFSLSAVEGKKFDDAFPGFQKRPADGFARGQERLGDRQADLMQDFIALSAVKKKEER